MLEYWIGTERQLKFEPSDTIAEIASETNLTAHEIIAEIEKIVERGNQPTKSYKEIMNELYPVDSVYINVVQVPPRKIYPTFEWKYIGLTECGYMYKRVK